MLFPRLDVPKRGKKISPVRPCTCPIQPRWFRQLAETEHFKVKKEKSHYIFLRRLSDKVYLRIGNCDIAFFVLYPHFLTSTKVIKFSPKCCNFFVKCASVILQNWTKLMFTIANYHEISLNFIYFCELLLITIKFCLIPKNTKIFWLNWLYNFIKYFLNFDPL